MALNQEVLSPISAFSVVFLLLKKWQVSNPSNESSTQVVSISAKYGQEWIQWKIYQNVKLCSDTQAWTCVITLH